MITIILIAVVFFGLALFGLSIGVIWGKRTPLKGACSSIVDNHGVKITDRKDHSCDTCTCHSQGDNRD